MARVLLLITAIKTGKYLSRMKYCANKVGLEAGPARGPQFDLAAEEEWRLDRLPAEVKGA